MKISNIDWRKRVFLTGGGFADIYRVASGFVAKVGSVSNEEYHLQRAAAAAGWRSRLRITRRKRLCRVR